MWSRVEQPEHRVRHQPRVGLGESGLELAHHAHPYLHVLALRSAHLLFGGGRQMSEVAVLNANEIWFAEREVEVEVDQPVERRVRRRPRGIGLRVRRRADEY